MKNNKKKVIVLLTCFCLVIFALLYLLFNNDNESDYIYVNIDRNNNVNNPTYYKEIINNARDEYNNNEVVGILEIDNTDYVVPIMQSDDNEYYLNHTPDGKENFMGSIYLDYRVDIDSSKKLLIYGHNSSNIDMPFKILEEFYDKDYYDNHKYVEITTSNTKKKYEIFSVYVETSDFSYMNINFENDDDYLNHIEKLKSKSMYDTGVTLSKDDEILILQTCSEHPDYRNYQKKYLLIILRRV
ncbi:MAG: class B sortase [Bacilli bacterium]